MISKKNLIAFVSLGLCGAVWAPQVIEQVGSPEPSTASVLHHEEEDEDEEEPFAMEEEAHDPVEQLVGTTADAGPKELLENTEQLLGKMESFAGGPAGLDLSELVRLMERRPTPRTLSTGSSTISAPVAEVEAQLLRSEELAMLQSFAEENALTGILASEAGASALLGHRVVRAGDRLYGGRVAIGTIDRTGLWLESENESVFLELPPFVARGRATGAEGADELAPLDDAGAEEAQESGQ